MCLFVCMLGFACSNYGLCALRSLYCSCWSRWRWRGCCHELWCGCVLRVFGVWFVSVGVVMAGVVVGIVVVEYADGHTNCHPSDLQPSQALC